LQRLAGCIDRGLNQVHTDQEEIRRQVKDVGQVAATLEPGNGSTKKRQAEFVALREEFHGSNDAHQQHLAKVMESFEPGLFVGGEAADLPQDNLDLERWFRLPKGHERRIHGHSHAGVRIVQEGPTLVLVLDAHQARQGPLRRRSYTRIVPACHRIANGRPSIGARSCARRALRRNGGYYSQNSKRGIRTKVSLLSGRC